MPELILVVLISVDRGSVACIQPTMSNTVLL